MKTKATDRRTRFFYLYTHTYRHRSNNKRLLVQLTYWISFPALTDGKTTPLFMCEFVLFTSSHIRIIWLFPAQIFFVVLNVCVLFCSSSKWAWKVNLNNRENKTLTHTRIKYNSPQTFYVYYLLVFHTFFLGNFLLCVLYDSDGMYNTTNNCLHACSCYCFSISNNDKCSIPCRRAVNKINTDTPSPYWSVNYVRQYKYLYYETCVDI